VLPAASCLSLRPPRLRRFLRHVRVDFAVFPEKITIHNDPTRGALALFEGGRTIPYEAVGGRKSFYGLVF